MLLLYHIHAPFAFAYYIPLSSAPTSYPRLVSASTSLPIPWTTGHISELESMSSAIRISDRGVRFISKYLTMRNFTSTANMLDVWDSITCILNPGSFCSIPENALLSTSQPVFPTTSLLVQITDYAHKVTEPTLRSIAERPCNAGSNRFIYNSTTYTPSLCDITHQYHDFIHTNDTLYVRRRNESVYTYAVLSIMLIILVTSTTLQATHMFHRLDYMPDIRITLCTCTMLTVVSISTINMMAYVTVADLVYVCIVISYIFVSLMHWLVHIHCYNNLALHTTNSLVLADLKETTSNVPLNLTIATILLAICRMYDGIECTYTTPLLFIMCTRTIYKLYSVIQYEDIIVNHASEMHTKVDTHIVSSLLFIVKMGIFLDIILIAFTYQFGFKPSFFHAHQSDAYFIILLLVSFTCATYAADHTSQHQSERPSDSRT